MMISEVNWTYKEASERLKEPVLTAASLGIHEFVDEVLKAYPNSVLFYDEKKRHIFLLAISYRKEKVFSLIHDQMASVRDYCTYFKDSEGDRSRLGGGSTVSSHNVKSGQLIGPIGSCFVRADAEEVGSGHDVHEGRESGAEEGKLLISSGCDPEDMCHRGEKDVVSKDLEVLWEDGYGTQSVKDYLDAAKEIIKPDGGPPRWFCPVECGPPLKNSPTLLFLPGHDGLVLGLILHDKPLGKCLHIPVHDRTPFEGLVKFIEQTVRLEHASSPNKPIYLVGDSFGGCLALAVAARNPSIDLVLILVDPDKFSDFRSQLQPLFPLLEALPDELHVTVPYLLSFVMGDPMKMAMDNIDSKLPSRQRLEQMSGNLTALLPHLSGMADIIPRDTLLWKLKLLKSASAYANSRLHAVKAEVLMLASGKDNMHPSGDEAKCLKSTLQNCNVRYFKDNGHTLLLQEFVSDQQEFVRMAARFGATIVPFGAVGEDDIADLVLDYNALMKIPVVNDIIKENSHDINIRDETSGEVANQRPFIPGILLKVLGRFYYLFGKPIRTKGKQDFLKDKENANQVYLHVKSEVESCIAYLLKKREEDPYRNIADRTVFRATWW
ncbi:hypothetical protein EZV62_007084 [Acer yangbiense]|uniref:Uncharacterized protein n=1 Tax=Acer yangbiense TaxID=1000413 RepID=A0A5C7IAP2_9ROSI|nr:hypothetical protein EZV62_007084 [Acer yangbiense]